MTIDLLIIAGQLVVILLSITLLFQVYFGDT